MSPPVFRNLIVEDFHPEFVGEKGILVHEITYRSPVRALVPGLLKDETEKKSDDERQTMERGNGEAPRFCGRMGKIGSLLAMMN